MSRVFHFSIFFFLIMTSLCAQGLEWGMHQYVIRGEVYVDLEPIYLGHIDEEYPLDINTAGQRALEESAMFFSAMIYGWSFDYEVGERARRISELLDLNPLGEIIYGDPAMKVTDTDVKDMRLRVWTDYQLSDSLQRRMEVWRSDTVRNIQGLGYGPSFIEEYPGWLTLKKMALEDAARSALRSMLRNTERNRPKEVRGFICLASFPRYFVDGGRWAASARFRVQIVEIIPYSVY